MDSGNVLSILQALGTSSGQGQTPMQPPAPATNVLQAAAPPQAAPAPVYQDPTAQIAQAATAESPTPPRKRASLVDIIGHLADGIAVAGGGTPMYQRTVDAMQAHNFAGQDHDLSTQKSQLALATGKFDLSDKQQAHANDERSRFANVLDAINDPEDAGNMPAAMAAAGLTDPRYAPFVKMVQDNPEVAKTLSSALGGGDNGELGKQIKSGYDSTGKRVAYVVDTEGNPHILSGVTPDQSIKVVNTGDKTSLIGPDGNPIKIIPNKISPNAQLSADTSTGNNQRTTQTQLTIAGMPARPKDAATGGKGSDPSTGLKIISDIQQSFDNLHNLEALPGEGGALGNIVGTIGRTGLGQTIGAKTGLSSAAQEREILAKNLANLQSDLIKSLPGNATRTKFEQEIQKKRLPDPTTMNYATANRAIAQIREAYNTALKSQPAASAAPVNSNLPTLSPADAMKLAPGTHFRTLDGRELVRH